jgi:hypothetical protein
MTQTTTTTTKGTVIGTYRMPRQGGQPSVTLACTLYSDRVEMSGGQGGSYAIPGTAWDRKRVAAHWAGYVSNCMGRTVKPAALRFAQEAK